MLVSQDSTLIIIYKSLFTMKNLRVFYYLNVNTVCVSLHHARLLYIQGAPNRWFRNPIKLIYVLYEIKA
jgi:hypothetical protein